MENAGRSDVDFLVPANKDHLFAEFRPLVKKLVFQYGDDAHMRDDLVGEIYWRFSTIVDAYDPSRNVPLRPYIVRQLTASVYSYIRKHNVHRSREVHVELDLDDTISDLCEDPTGQWDDSLTLDAIRDVLPTALATLSERQRRVVMWRYYDDVSFERIADLLEIQPATARSLLRHALTNMRNWFVKTKCGL
jgi:RNA polymerase sigma factor (sigma-70 family)